MNRLLIVDDEHHIVDWLVEMFEDNKELELEIYKAYNGIQALAILDKLKIDVVLSDIKMPGLNGFELLEKIQSNWPKSRVIFLTGYNEFDYAYKANQYANVRYLLKTEDDDTIVAAVYSAIQSIESDRIQSRALDHANQREKLMNHMFIREMVIDRINGKVEVNILNYSSQQEIGLKFHSPVVMLYIRFMWHTEVEGYLEHGERVLHLQQIMERMLEQKGITTVIDMNQNVFLCLLQPAASITLGYRDCASALQFYLREMLEDILQACTHSLNCNALILLYESLVPWNQIISTYEYIHFLALKEMRVNAAATICRVVSEAEISKISEVNKQVLKEHVLRKQLSQLQSCLEQGERDRFERVLNQISSVLEKVNSMHYTVAVEAYVFISGIYLSYINQHHLSDKLVQYIHLNKLHRLEEFDSWKEVVDYLQKLGKMLFDLNTAERKHNNEYFIEQVCKYIEDNLDQDLSLSAISQNVNYNPSYVSRLFKQVAGVNLFDYINTARIERAKHLLIRTDMTAQEIAKKVGYDSSQYFSTMFKKNLAMTPQEYRKKHS
ncbi:helix-turn-helix domain-containing protein [Paenibacillus thiaminolyticus]|uniref:response regulator transcription factor n=1 Tax=Paenibacillus thiaminolyticus TaxID=49283 RepID=UPI0035A609BA